jgi:hypothetical protein
MKTFLMSVTSALAILAALPANAGPNWTLIEQGRKDKTAQQTAPTGQTAQREQMQTMMKQCADMMEKPS